MALKALMLRKKIDSKTKELEKLREKSAEFETREAELETAIAEAETEEEQAAVNESIDAFTAERDAHKGAIDSIEAEIAELEGQLAEEERAQNTDPKKEEKREGKKEMQTAEKRNRFGITEELVKREDMQEFLLRVRDHIAQKRAISNAGLLIPEVFLGILRENVIRYSKLLDHINYRRIGGEGRIAIAGGIPEAVWTECCANLNELNLAFYETVVDCNKLGGYFAVCNAILEDSDVDLAAELAQSLSQAIGYALDKAILYGTGTKMPLGVVTRLAQTAAPADYPATARPWADLHTSNIASIAANVTGLALFQALAVDAGAAKGSYSRGEKTWVMNETTYTKLIAQAMSVNAAGAIVSGMDGRMPVLGGAIEVLSFIPDNVIIGGYFDLYLLAERRGVQIGQSEHTRFIEDQTVFKGTARYDGQPVIAEGFVAVGIGGVTPTAAMTFAPDTANQANEDDEGE